MSIKLRINESNSSKKALLRISESSLIKEGAGGGATASIDGISDVKITSAYVEEDWNGGAKLAVTGRLTIDELWVESYYYGTGKIENARVRLNSIVVDTDYLDIPDIDNLDDDELINIAYEALDSSDAYKFEASYGGADIGDEDTVWEGTLMDDALIDFIEKAVDGENFIEEYLVDVDGDYDFYESEDEAMEVAERLTEDPKYEGCLIEVRRRIEYYGWGDNWDDFIDSTIEETIYSEYNEVEPEDEE